MTIDLINHPSMISTTRRRVIAGAVKLAYVPPFVAASSRLTVRAAGADEVVSGGVVCPEPIDCGGDCVLFPTPGGDVCGLDRLCDEVAACGGVSGCATGEVCASTCGCPDKPSSCVSPCGGGAVLSGLAVESGRRQSGRVF
jgi:hypothetical protein